MNKEVSVKKQLDLYWVDAFTKEIFKGNAAAVVVLREQLDEKVMQSIAAEMNVSETAFVNIIQCKDNKYSLRWFTPKVEVPMCGHATIAVSKVLFDILGVRENEIQYDTKSGILTAKRHSEGIILDFPVDLYERVEVPQQLLKALGIEKIENCIYGKHTKKLVIHVCDQQQIINLNVDFEKMKSLSFEMDIKGVGVTAKGNGKYDFISRYFNPWAGVNEDPVTGSVHTVLAPYWSKLLGKNELSAYQASSRGGELKLKLNSNGRMNIIGEAVVLLKGKLDILEESNF